MTQGVPELTIPELLDQPWTKRAGRIAAFLAVFISSTMSGVLGAYFVSLGNRITAIEKDRATRIVAVNDGMGAINAKIVDLQTTVASMSDDVSKVKIDVGTVRGILQEMQRHEVSLTIPASPFSPRTVASGGSQ